MRNRIHCDKCSFKSTSITALTLHKNSNHNTKKEYKNKGSNRIQCEECDKKFNKESTFKVHMRNVHQKTRNQTQEGQV